MKDLGLVLSGGGIRGMAHVGLIAAMREFDWDAKCIAGSSIGALVGALYAAEYTPEDMLDFFENTPLLQYNFFTINKAGLINTERYFDAFKSYFPKNSFEDLSKELFVIATDLLGGKEHAFHSGELIHPLLASAALTPVFSPLEFEGVLYADGGIMNNFPKEYIENKAKVIFGSNVTVVGQLEKKHIRNPVQLTTRVTGLMIYASSSKKLAECDLFIEPQGLEKIGLFNKKHIQKAYTLGYDHASRAMEEWLAKEKK